MVFYITADVALKWLSYLPFNGFTNKICLNEHCFVLIWSLFVFLFCVYIPSCLDFFFSIKSLCFYPRPQDLSLPNGTPVDTSSPASSSSLLNRLQLDDDLDGETRDLFVTVDDPKKHVSTMETYITYRVCTKVRRQSS